MIDMGADGNCMDHATATQIGIPLRDLNNPPLNTIDRDPIGEGTNCYCTIIVTIHTEKISFLITNTLRHPIILGIPWLQRHDPLISWSTH